ncbi:MAG: hypothetical protein AMXMBFR59_25730 [Rhodanobacteraceae bacterium]
MDFHAHTDFVAMKIRQHAWALVFLAGSSPAWADGAFLAARVGSSDLEAESGIPDGFGNASGYRVAGGYRWGAFGIEAGYTNLGSASDLFTASTGPLQTRELELDGWTLGVHGRFRLSERWHLLARGGLFRWNSDLDLGLNGDHAHFDDYGTRWYAGVGIGVDIGRRFSVTLDADRYEAEPDGRGVSANVVSLGAEIRFQGN